MDVWLAALSTIVRSNGKHTARSSVYMSMDNEIMQISSQKPRNEVNWMTINKIVSRHDRQEPRPLTLHTVDRRDLLRNFPLAPQLGVNRF